MLKLKKNDIVLYKKENNFLCIAQIKEILCPCHHIVNILTKKYSDESFKKLRSRWAVKKIPRSLVNWIKLLYE